MKYLPLLCIGAILLLCLIPFCGGGNKNHQPQQSVVGTPQQTQQTQQTYQPQYAETMEGSYGTFYVKDVEDEIYKRGFRDGFDGMQGRRLVDHFDWTYQFVVGKPENKKQKEDYKKYRDRMYKAYTKGAEEGFDGDMAASKVL